MARTALFGWLSNWAQEQFKTLDSGLSDTPVTRRQFLKGATATSLAAVLAPQILKPGFAQTVDAATDPDSSEIPVANKSRDGQEPIVIVGGGLAGLTAAYCLRMQGLSSVLYEGSERLGGRMHTLNNFNDDGMFVELGAELVDTNHMALRKLCEELKVPVETFATFDKGLSPVLWAEGKQRTEEEFKEGFAPLAKQIALDLKQCFPADVGIAVPTYWKPYQAQWMDLISLGEYLDKQTTVPKWVNDIIKAAYTGEYGRDPNEQSALNLLLLLGLDTSDGIKIFGESDEAWRIQGGSSRLTDALALSLKPDVPMNMGQTLIGIERTSDKRIKLSFRDSNRKHTALTAARVIMAIPFSTLRDVQGIYSLPLTDVKKRCIAEWSYGTNTKQMIGFKSRFWRDKAGAAPLAPNTGEIFSDTISQCFWETSRLQKGNSGIITNFLGGKAGKDATADGWRDGLKDFSRLFPIAESQLDGKRAHFNATTSRLRKGSYSCPAPGQYTTLMGAAGEPELDNTLYFAGEHCSVDWAGFMNGAVESGYTAATMIAASFTTAGVHLPEATAPAP